MALRAHPALTSGVSPTLPAQHDPPRSGASATNRAFRHIWMANLDLSKLAFRRPSTFVVTTGSVELRDARHMSVGDRFTDAARACLAYRDGYLELASAVAVKLVVSYARGVENPTAHGGQPQRRRGVGHLGALQRAQRRTPQIRDRASGRNPRMLTRGNIDRSGRYTCCVAV